MAGSRRSAPRWPCPRPTCPARRSVEYAPLGERLRGFGRGVLVAAGPSRRAAGRRRALAPRRRPGLRGTGCQWRRTAGRRRRTRLKTPSGRSSFALSLRVIWLEPAIYRIRCRPSLRAVLCRSCRSRRTPKFRAHRRSRPTAVSGSQLYPTAEDRRLSHRRRKSFPALPAVRWSAPELHRELPDRTDEGRAGETIIQWTAAASHRSTRKHPDLQIGGEHRVSRRSPTARDEQCLRTCPGRGGSTSHRHRRSRRSRTPTLENP